MVREVTHRMAEHDVLTYASAIAFQVLTSLIPLALLVLAAAGYLGAGDVWTQDLAPEFKAQVSKEVYAVADEVVMRTLGKEQVWWLTLGFVFTLWQVSGVARAIMGVLADVYNHGDDRSFKQRYLISFALGTGVTVLLVAAFLLARFGDGGPLAFVARWTAALALLFTAVWVLLRFAPPHPDPHRWISFGSALCVIAWVGTSLVFGLYITQIADYGSIFGSLATVFVLLTYLYVSAAAFLIGAEVDAIVRGAWRKWT